MAMPPRRTVPLREPANSRTAECESRCQGEASSARAPVAAQATDKVAAKPSATRIGTITVMERLYRQVSAQTIELLVMWSLTPLQGKQRLFNFDYIRTGAFLSI